MDNLFLLLFLFSLLSLVVGLIKPSVITSITKIEFNRKKVFTMFGISTLLFLIIFAVTTPPPDKKQISATSEVNENLTKPAFDVPALLGKNIDEVRTILGTPTDKTLTEPNVEQIKLGTKEWDNTFSNEGKELLVTYNVKTRKVIDLFISTDDSSGMTKDKQQLLRIGNLIENDSKYSIEFVKTMNDNDSYTGIKITPNSTAL